MNKSDGNPENSVKVWRDFIYKDNKSDKFWSIYYINGSLEYIVNYGKSGSEGRFNRKIFDNEKTCRNMAEKLMCEKIKKGYIEDFSREDHKYFDIEPFGLSNSTSHPNFNEYFKSDFYYDCGSEGAPFGNDNGNDVLKIIEEQYLNGKVDIDAIPRKIVEEIWGMIYVEPKDVSLEDIKKLIELKDEDNILTTDQVIIAAAFGQIKITGYISECLKKNVLLSLKRIKLLCSLCNWNFLEYYDIMKADLENFRKQKDITLKQLIHKKYKQKYFNECKFIWKNYVPKSGQSNVLQGELLRELEKLRFEAQNNGNMNWDNDFSYFCDFIKETLCKQSIYSDEERTTITLVLNYIKDCGNYAQQYNNQQIPEVEVDAERIAYTEDNLYDIIADAIGLFQIKTPEPIPFKPNSKIKR